ncbi:MAG TPA: hypothetical protein VI216_06805 [Candidatus Acidoferrales bacterium]
MGLRPELWIGLVQLKPLDREAFGAAGAYTNIITWAADKHEFRSKAESIAATMNLYVVEIEDEEPFAERVREFQVDEEIEDMAQQAVSDPNAILCGTFHRYPQEEA